MKIPAHAYREELKVEPAHIDELQHVNNVVYLQWVQDVSAEHWFSLCPRELQKKYFWVVRRHELDYFRQAVVGDILHIYTWPSRPVGASSIRYVCMVNASTGKTVMEAKSKWTMLNAFTLRPEDVPEEIIRVLDLGDQPNGE